MTDHGRVRPAATRVAATIAARMERLPAVPVSPPPGPNLAPSRQAGPVETVPAKCRNCLRVRPPAELLEVRDVVTGERFAICRPGNDEPFAGDCFRSIGPASRFAISLAAPITIRRVVRPARESGAR